MEETINIKTEPMDCPKVENEIGDSFTILAGSKSGILKGELKRIFSFMFIIL